jgi:hypothetical protein
VLPLVDGVAAENVDFSTRKQDRRQGWRGAEAHLEGAARDTFLERQARLYGDAPIGARRQLAIVEEVQSSRARVRVGNRIYDLPLKNMSWAGKWSKNDATNDVRVESVAAALRPGDVVWIARPPGPIRKFSDWTYDEKLNAHWLPEREAKLDDNEVVLAQTPRVQASIYTIDHDSGYVLAMVGGQDYARSEFNRAVQSCRQPGSTYKPIYYSAALDEGYSFDTMLNDIPKAEVDPITGEVWVPVNLHGTMDFSVSLEYALVFSKNVPSVDIFSKVGAKNVERWARDLGFTSPIIADKALALGASCVYPSELARAFAIFARNGRWLEPVYIRRVLDRDGNVLEDHTVAYDPLLPRPTASTGSPPPPVRRPAGDRGAHRLPHHQAAPLGGHRRLLRLAARHRHPRGGQDRHLVGDHGPLVRRLHLALAHRLLDGRRSARAAAGQGRRGLHDGGARLGPLHRRGRGRLAAPGHPLGSAGGRLASRPRRQPRPQQRRRADAAHATQEGEGGRAADRRRAASFQRVGPRAPASRR